MATTFDNMTMERTRLSKSKRIKMALSNPAYIQRELNNRSFYEFFKCFWHVLNSEPLVDNWHLEYLCNELQYMAEKVDRREPVENDIIINIPPGTTKTSIVSIFFPAWCWTKWKYMRFITCSYSSALSLESAEASRDLVRSAEFKDMYPEIDIKADKDTKSNFRIMWTRPDGRIVRGGNRFSTSVGGSVTGYHAHIIIWDDPLNPEQSHSKVELEKANRYIDETLSSRKVNKEVSAMVGIMQRLHQNDCTGHLLSKKAKQIHHICLPGEINRYKEQLRPKFLEMYYKDGLFDPIRMSHEVLRKMEIDLGQYGFSGQIGQNPVPPGGGMFKVDKFQYSQAIPFPHEISRMVRYWDKAGTTDGGAYTVGVKMFLLTNGFFLVVDVVRGQWGSAEREKKIQQVTQVDGKSVEQWFEQEPGSGGKESAESTIRNLAGYKAYKEIPKGDKAKRADPFSVQVNNGNVILLTASWNQEFIDEYRFFPFSKYKDQVDAGSAAFAKLATKKKARTV